MRVVKVIFNTIVNILIVAILITSIAIAILSVTRNNDGLPHLFGHSLLSVQTDSMYPAIYAGDLIVSQLLTEDMALQEGDVVTFPWVENEIETTMTHRIARTEQVGDETLFYTKGDNNPAEDEGYQTRSSILAVFNEEEGVRLVGWGRAMDVLQSRQGFFFAIVLPMILFFLYEMFRFISSLMAYSREKARLETEAEFEKRLAEQQANAPPPLTADNSGPATGGSGGPGGGVPEPAAPTEPASAGPVAAVEADIPAAAESADTKE